MSSGSSGLTIDPQDLNNFATDVRTLVQSLTDAKTATDPNVAVDKAVKFGQGASFADSLHVSLTASPISFFRSGLINHTTDFDDNFKTLIGKLNLLADTADAIAKKYKDAAELDHANASDINALLNSTDTTPTTANG